MVKKPQQPVTSILGEEYIFWKDTCKKSTPDKKKNNKKKNETALN